MQKILSWPEKSGGTVQLRLPSPSWPGTEAVVVAKVPKPRPPSYLKALQTKPKPQRHSLVAYSSSEDEEQEAEASERSDKMRFRGSCPCTCELHLGVPQSLPCPTQSEPSMTCYAVPARLGAWLSLTSHGVALFRHRPCGARAKPPQGKCVFVCFFGGFSFEKKQILCSITDCKSK